MISRPRYGHQRSTPPRTLSVSIDHDADIDRAEEEFPYGSADSPHHPQNSYYPKGRCAISAGDQKADFRAIYDLEYPRDFYAALMPLDYQIPQNALPMIQAAQRAAGGERVLLDVCCSYGVNAALLRHDLDLKAVAAHVTDPARTADPDTLVAQDAGFFAARRHADATPVVGLDVARLAIAYGLRSGVLTAGFAENLETDDPSPALLDALAPVGLLVCTGGVGYVGPATFRRILAALAEPGELWAVVYVLRLFDYADIAAAFAEHGLITEQVTAATARQRRFADPGEQAAAVRGVRERGLDPTGREADGWYWADCFLTRPAAAATTPAGALLDR